MILPFQLCLLWRQYLQFVYYRELFNTNQKKEKSISALLVMALPERVAFGLSLASSSSELMNARMTSLESSSPESMALSLSYSSLSLSSVSLLSVLALLSFCVIVLPFRSVVWPALRRLVCCSNVLQLPLLCHSCCSSNAASARGGSSICLILEHAVF